MSLPCRAVLALPLLFILLMSFAEAGDLTGTVRISGPNVGAEVLVWLEAEGRPVPTPIPQHLVLDQKDMRFIPLILPVPINSTVEFRNSDEVHHSVFSPSKTKRFDLGTYPKTVQKTLKFEKPGMIIVLCNIHSNMESYLVVLDNPFFTMTKKDGSFFIPRIMPGSYKLRVFHPKLREFRKLVTIPEKGTLELDVQLVP